MSRVGCTLLFRTAVWMRSVADWATPVLQVFTAEDINVFAVIFWAVVGLYGETCDQRRLCV